jgi:hypothetical protein
MAREFHPLRFQRWILSDLNPWLGWLGPAAALVKAQRQALPPDDPARKTEKAFSEVVSASLDYYRAVRDALSEAAFFQLYGNLLALDVGEAENRPAADLRLPSVAQGGYPQALARVAFLLARRGKALPLSRVEMKQELMKDYAEFIPELPRDEQRRIRGEQEVIVRREPDQAVATLPELLASGPDRERLLGLLERLLADARVQSEGPSKEQLAMLARIRAVLASPKPRRPQPQPA